MPSREEGLQKNLVAMLCGVIKIKISSLKWIGNLLAISEELGSCDISYYDFDLLTLEDRQAQCSSACDIFFLMEPNELFWKGKYGRS